MSRVRTGLTWGVVAGAIGVLLLFGWSSRARFAPADAGSEVPAYRAASLSGDTIALADFRGRLVLLNVWATWCTPCVREMPALERLYRSLSDEGLSVVAVSVDASTGGLGPTDVRGFVEELGVTFPVLLDPGGQIERMFRIGGLPMTFLIDREGRVVERVIGAREWDDPEVTAGIRKLLDG